MEKTLSEHEAWFREYAAEMRARETEAPGPMDLKVEHTIAVLERARRIADASLPKRLHRAAYLAALYHDIARFEQYLKWHTFKDAASVNHALLGARLLKELHCLDMENAATRGLVRAAVALHNRYAVPANVEADVCLVTYVVRDADKLDILRVMDKYFSGTEKDGTVVLNVKDEPDKVSPSVVHAALSGNIAKYSDLRYENDFRILLGTWIHDLHYPVSRRMAAEEGHMRSVLSGLPSSSQFECVREALLRQLEMNSRE